MKHIKKIFLVSFFLFSRLTEKECNLSGGVIHFTVMDHDLMWSNDFEGEAFLEISKLSGIPNDSFNDNRSLDELKQTELCLTHPKGLNKQKKKEFLNKFIFYF
jgi:hypothetical protein